MVPLGFASLHGWMVDFLDWLVDFLDWLVDILDRKEEFFT